MGSGENGALTFVDLLGILSFAVGLQNLEINLTQEDLQRESAKLDARVDEQVRRALSEIHAHLKVQDEKIDRIIKELEYAHGKKTV